MSAFLASVPLTPGLPRWPLRQHAYQLPPPPTPSPTGNGVLYVMDAVLAPPAELVSTAQSVPQLSTFVRALEATGLAVSGSSGGSGCSPRRGARCCGGGAAVCALSCHQCDGAPQQREMDTVGRSVGLLLASA